MSKTQISIIVPFYNRLELLEQTIQSVLNQTSDFWELILVDDGTTEDFSELYQKYNSESVKFLKKSITNKGANFCRNRGAQEAKNEFIMFLDSDDLLAPWCIETRVNEIKKEKETELWFFNGVEFDTELKEFTRLRTIFECKNPLREFLNFQSVCQTSCAVWCKKAFHEIGGWDVTVNSWQDGELFVRYLAHRNKFLWSSSELPDVLIRKHNSDNRISNAKGLNKIVNLFETYDKVLNYLDEPYASQFDKNIKSNLYDIAEGIKKETYSNYIDWIYTLNISNKHKRRIKQYAYLYTLLNKNGFMNRVLYQIRKTPLLFNQRQGFWSIRPQVKNEVKLQLNNSLPLE